MNHKYLNAIVKNVMQRQIMSNVRLCLNYPYFEFHGLFFCRDNPAVLPLASCSVKMNRDIPSDPFYLPIGPVIHYFLYSNGLWTETSFCSTGHFPSCLLWKGRCMHSRIYCSVSIIPFGVFILYSYRIKFIYIRDLFSK